MLNALQRSYSPRIMVRLPQVSQNSFRGGSIRDCCLGSHGLSRGESMREPTNICFLYYGDAIWIPSDRQ